MATMISAFLLFLGMFLNIIIFKWSTYKNYRPNSNDVLASFMYDPLHGRLLVPAAFLDREWVYHSVNFLIWTISYLLSPLPVYYFATSFIVSLLFGMFIGETVMKDKFKCYQQTSNEEFKKLENACHEQYSNTNKASTGGKGKKLMMLLIIAIVVIFLYWFELINQRLNNLEISSDTLLTIIETIDENGTRSERQVAAEQREIPAQSNSNHHSNIVKILQRGMRQNITTQEIKKP